MNDYSHLIHGYEMKVPTEKGSRRYINLDNAASTPPFTGVIKHLNNISAWYSGVHRGSGYKSGYSTEQYEAARETIAQFVGADLRHNVVIFTKNTTDSINKVRHYLPYLPGEIVIFSRMEHHSNELPWMDGPYHMIRLKRDRLDLEELEDYLRKQRGRIKLVAVTGCSNVSGYTPPIYTIAEIAHLYDAKILVDGAQLVPHRPVNLLPDHDPRHIDFLAFSAHKMYAPFGAGVLIGPKWLFSKGNPSQVGGGTIKFLTPEEIFWTVPPDREEAGSPNVLGALAVAEACRIISGIGWLNLINHEKELIAYAMRELTRVPGITIYGKNSENRVGVVSFNIEGIHHRQVADYLAKVHGIGVRSGCFCARRYVIELLQLDIKELLAKLGGRESLPDEIMPGMVRISFGCYNQIAEIDLLCEALMELIHQETTKPLLLTQILQS
jgi:cysteine desulfurase/selenocysteine lyase